MSHSHQHITEVYYHSIEIAIEGGGSAVKIEQALPLLYDMVDGVFVLHPGGNHGKGTMALSVAGEEIFPENFHARAFMCIQSSHREDAMITKEPDSYMYEFSERAKGSTVAIKYTEPLNGENGVIYLILKLTRKKLCE